ncbi:MAG: hypothetical protein JSS49_29285 [Planctomycetes bacterium]|nr:hypothetical protein [Planctomycetota bacterium]
MPVCHVRAALIPGFIFAWVAVAAAQSDDKANAPSRTPYYGSGGSTLIFLLTKPGVQQELRLEDSASQKLLASLRELDPTHVSFRTPDEKRWFAELRVETERKSKAAIQKSLSEEQFRRLQELEAQYLGGRVLLSPKTADRFALTADQQERLRAISAEFGYTGQAGAPRLSAEEASARMEKYNSDLLAVLTPDQMNQWKAMSGAPFKFPKSLSGPSWRLIYVPEVQTELGLSEDEVAALVQSLAAIQKEDSRARFGRGPAQAPGNHQQVIDTVRHSLSVAQWNRLQELILQQHGVELLSHPEVADKLGLNRDQQVRVRTVIDEYRRDQLKRSRPGVPVNVEESRTRREKEHADLLDILTREQKEQWEEMQGAIVDPLLLFSSRTLPTEK